VINFLTRSISLFESDVVDDHGPALDPTFFAEHAHGDGSQLLENITLQVELRGPLGLVEGIEFQLVRIEGAYN
jgi:hypothetical protein